MKEFCFYTILLLLPIIGMGQASGNDNTILQPKIESAKIIGEHDTTHARKMFLDIIERAHKSANDHAAAKAYLAMGEMYFTHKNHNRSFGAYFNARPLFNKIKGTEKEQAATQFGMGRAQYYRGNYKVAAQHLSFALKESQQQRMLSLQSDCLEYLGILFHVMPLTNNQDISHFKKALLVKETLGDKKGMLRMLEKLGDCYFDMKRYDSALYFIDQAGSMSNQLRLTHDANITKLNRAGVLIRLNRLPDALKEIETIEQHADTSDLNINIRLHIQKGNHALANDQQDESAVHYARALSLADEIGVPEMYGLVYKQVSDAYHHKQRYQEAYEYAVKYNTQLSGYYAENVAVLKDLQYILESNTAKDELTLLNLQNTINGERLKNERRSKYFYIIAIVTFIILASLIFHLYRKQRNKNRVIQLQAEEVRTLNKEIHHRLKNNLQTVSSLLDLQSMTVKDPQASQALKEGRNRVQTMAFIHQDLYGEKNMDVIEANTFFSTLTQKLFTSYNINHDEISLATDIDTFTIDVETVTSIGLVLSELISNCLKHAFTPGAKGNVDVKLKRIAATIMLSVKDDGRGFNESNDPIHSSTFGIRMTKIFAQKLKADLSIYNDHGGCVTMKIPYSLNRNAHE